MVLKRSLTAMVWLIVISLGCVTAMANFRFGMLVGAGEERYVYAIGGTVLDVVKTFLPTILGTFLHGRLTPGTFFRTVAGWSIWLLGVVWSITCALGLYAITKEARVGDTKGTQATYQQLVSDQERKRGRLDELSALRSYEVVEGEIAAQKRNRLWTRTRECTDATASASRDYCAGVDRLNAEMAAARHSEDIQDELSRIKSEARAIEVKLAGVNMNAVFEKADPATDALVSLTGWEGETVKSRLALLLALLFEGGGLLLWITTGGHGHAAPEAPKPVKRRPEPSLTPPEPSQAEGEPEPARVDIPEVDSLVAQWGKQALVRRKGSFTPAGDVRNDFEAWCRLNGHEPINPTAFGKQMTSLGFERKKVGGNLRYTDIALRPKAAPSLRIVAAN